MLKTARFVVLLYLLIANSFISFSQEGEVGNSEKLIASYVFNFLSQIEFPESQKDEDIHLLVITKDKEHKEIYRAIKKMYDGKKTKSGTNKKLIHVDKASDVSKAKNYNVLLVPFSLDNKFKDIYALTKTENAFIMGLNGDYLYSMLNFVVNSGKISFELNNDRIQERGYAVSDRLRKLSATSKIEFQRQAQEYEKAYALAQKENKLQDQELASQSEQIDDLEESNMKNLNKSLELQDSLDIAEQMAKLQEEKVAQQSELISKQDKIMNQQRFIIIISIFSGILILILFYFVYSSRNKVRNKNLEISEQKAQLESQNEEILDSIKYAKRIQSAILPPAKLIDKHLADYFILYKPKDIVAGDFYWMEKVARDKNRGTSEDPASILIAAADCTGHGVPGAMVSVVCNNALNRSVRLHKLVQPSKILDKTREIVVEEFEKSEEEVKDGMDIALVSLTSPRSSSANREAGSTYSKLLYAGANNPLWIIRNGASEIEEIKGDKQPIGKFENEKPYTSHEIMLKKGDCFYIFSDGYADQFGGKKGKKFKTRNLKKLFLSVKDLPMVEQKKVIDQEFEKWKGGLEQLDDVCIIGVRV